ncbi:MAG TPA: nucleotidyltransferase domain-containing protein [Spirochaetota bacterium]|nr:nucleotidyltransferase domain-containing protein [Spirochaetota bacterium]HPJ38953.1 nucleotidyltransferase domain-containing protein [Spirochaetota bacterium]HPQ55237.1 nucleotidyltransferase domain-containing protein [Spirochaetota bacterium]
MNSKEIEKIIAERLESIRPDKAILFGSFAYGQPGEDSDIDLIVVLNKRGFPQSYNEKMENYRLIRRLFRDINEVVPLDIIVYTIDEWNSFIATGSSFSLQILEKGKAIA